MGTISEKSLSNLQPFEQGHSGYQDRFIVSREVNNRMRGAIMKQMLKMPCMDILKHNQSMLAIAQEKYGENLDLFTVEMLLDAGLIFEFLANPTSAMHRQIKEDAYGKRKEEQPDKASIELPQMPSPKDLLDSIKIEDLRDLLQIKEKQLKETEKEKSELIIQESKQKPLNEFLLEDI